MPPTAKDLDVATSASPSPSSAGAGKAQPVALEVPVTVNGARTVAGSDKREPFSETTQTVLVFGNGAVIRLASTVAPGQLLFLTNEKTKKEVVCQVLKSKNYSTVSGYVELEFTEAVAGFWGIRFAAEPVAKPSAPAPLSAKPAVAAPATRPQTQTPAVSNLPKPAASPVKTESVTTTAVKAEVKPPVNLPRVSEPIPTSALPKAPAGPNSSGTSVTISSGTPEVHTPVVSSKAPVTPVVSSAPLPPHAPSSSDVLRRESARLQEQLSSLQFNSQVPGTAKPATPESPSKIIEIAKSQPPVAKAAPPIAKTSGLHTNLEAGEVQIPSWLEPLARNAATPSQNDLTPSEAGHQIDGLIEFEVQDVSAPATTHEIEATKPPEAELATDIPAFGELTVREHVPARANNQMILIAGLAAGFLVLAAGGTWVLRRSPSPSVQTASASTDATGTTTQPATQPATRNGSAGPAFSANNPGAPTGNTSSLPSASPQPVTPSAQPLKGAPEKTAAAELSAYKRLAEPQPQPVVQPLPKKPSLGEVHLAAPAAAHRPSGQDVATAPADLAASFGASQPIATGDALGGSLVGGTAKLPVAPTRSLPVGGDVKQAKLISSTPPTYPVLAKAQHVEGNVRVDALVDEHGHVSVAKVVSGPTLLHQAAMDAIRQWKYEPATLDGKPVAMHLTVTLQFRLQ
jgi:periplasmic protein TonB